MSRLKLMERQAAYARLRAKEKSMSALDRTPLQQPKPKQRETDQADLGKLLAKIIAKELIKAESAEAEPVSLPGTNILAKRKRIEDGRNRRVDALATEVQQLKQRLTQLQVESSPPSTPPPVTTTAREIQVERDGAGVMRFVSVGSRRFKVERGADGLIIRLVPEGDSNAD